MSARRWSAPRLAAVAAAAALTAVTARGHADDPIPCSKPEQGSAEECARIETYSPDFTQTLIPNNWLHATVRGFSHFTWNYGGSGSFREIPGFGFLLGVAPLDTQVLRLSAGMDVVIAPRPDDGRQEASVEPRFRVSAGNFGALAPILPVDVYANAVVPVWTGQHRTGWGVGGGFSFRILNRIAGEIGYEAVRDPAMGAGGASPFFHRATALVGVDIVAMVPNSKNHVAKPTPSQIQIDLRCAMLEDVAAFQRKAGSSPPYCADVMAALTDEELEDGERSTSAFLRHLAPKQHDLAEKLRGTDDHLEACRQSIMREQRRCVDCTGAKMKRWPSYVMDPHQIAEVLGCIPGARPAGLQCDKADLTRAVELSKGCGI